MTLSVLFALENVTACSFKIQCCCISCVLAWTSLFILWDRQMTMACACSGCGSEWCRHADMRPISSGLYMCANERFCKKHEIVIRLSPDFKNMWTLDSTLNLKDKCKPLLLKVSFTSPNVEDSPIGLKFESWLHLFSSIPLMIFSYNTCSSQAIFLNLLCLFLSCV